MYVLANMWFQNIMRTFFFSVDKIVFGFISTIYDLLITIARTSVLSQADILDMADRVYKLLAVFMVFKVTFSLIMYVVNPDDFSDKSKGVSKLGMNIVFSLAMLILTPYIFSYAYQLQTIILEDNSLAALVFGDDVTNAEDNPMNSAGDTMAFITLTPFFTPNISQTNAECGRLVNTDGTINEKCTGIEFDGSNFGNKVSGSTLHLLTKENGNFSESMLKNYIAGVSHGSLGMMFRLDMAVATNKGNTEFVMEYRYIFSTVVGVIVVLLLLTFCMDVALRSIKLAFLQLIAPIPILSYVDPKSGKDGMFKKWYQMCFKTYLSLFLRLLALYFAVYIISRVDRMVDIVDGSYQTNMFVKIFIIIGALMFAKSFTKILEGLGLKLDGGFTLNPLKKMENEMLGGKAVSKVAKTAGKYGKRAAVGLGLGATAGVGAFFSNLFDKESEGIRERIGSAVAGATSTTSRGLLSGLRGKKPKEVFTNSYSEAMSAKKRRRDRHDDDVGIGEVLGAKLTKATGGHTKSEYAKINIERLDNVSKGYDTIRSTVLAIDKVAKAQNEIVKGIESAGASAFKDGQENVRLSDGKTLKRIGIDSEKMTATQIYQAVKDYESNILDKRVIDLANGTATWSGDATAISNATTVVDNTINSMQSQIDLIKGDMKHGRITQANIADIIDSNGNVQNVKITGKGASTAKNVVSSGAAHAMDVEKYAEKNKK